MNWTIIIAETIVMTIAFTAITPDIQLSYDDYRQFDFSKDAELLFIEKLKMK